MNASASIRTSLRSRSLVALTVLAANVMSAVAREALADDAPARTSLGIEGTQFTLDGQPAFLLGISYYAGLGAPEAALQKDLDDIRDHGFNWLRLWANCGFYDQDISAFDEQGRPRDEQFRKLRWIVAECDRRGIVVDVTLTREAGGGHGGLGNFEAHGRAVEALVRELKEHRNWFLDLANERDVQDARYVPIEEIRDLRRIVRELDEKRLVTASLGGHDLAVEDLRESLVVAELDFMSPHRPRTPSSPAETDSRTRETTDLMRTLGRPAPILYQEPFRRGYENWQPSVDDFLTDLRGAKAGGAAGWCLHNGGTRGVADEQPRRSFDRRKKRLLDQLDDVEQAVLRNARSVIDPPAAP